MKKMLVTAGVAVVLATGAYLHAQSQGGEGATGTRDWKLTDQQRDQIREMLSERSSETVDLRRDIEHKRLAITQELAQDSPDRNVINKEIDQIAALMTRHQKARIEMLLKLKGVLTPEQWEMARRRVIERLGTRGGATPQVDGGWNRGGRWGGQGKSF